MQARHQTKRIWLFTEHRNATYIINFGLPLQAQGPQSNIRAESWSTQEVTDMGCATLITRLRSRGASEMPDVAIFSRFVLPYGQDLIALCRSLGILTLFHLDDLLQQLPEDIGEKYTATYSASFVAALNASILACDGVLVSTPVLGAHVSALYPQQAVRAILGVCYVQVPGWTASGIRSRLARLKRQLTHSGTQTLGYMGSSSHARDLATATPQIAQLLRKRPNLRFEILGMPAPEVLVREFGSRIRQYSFTTHYSGFLAALYEMNWDLGLAPLVRDEFNRSKTATKFLEYTACGIPTLAEDMEPYSQFGGERGAIAVATGGNWTDAVGDLLSDGSRRHRQLQNARRLCESRFAPEQTVAHLRDAIDQVAQATGRAI